MERRIFAFCAALVLVTGLPTESYAQFQMRVQKNASTRLTRPVTPTQHPVIPATIDTGSFDLTINAQEQKKREAECLQGSTFSELVNSSPLQPSPSLLDEAKKATPASRAPEPTVEPPSDGGGYTPPPTPAPTAASSDGIGIPVMPQTPLNDVPSNSKSAKVIVVGLETGAAMNEVQSEKTYADQIRAQYDKSGPLFQNQKGTIFSKDGKWAMDKAGKVYSTPAAIEEAGDALGTFNKELATDFLKANPNAIVPANAPQRAMGTNTIWAAP